MAASSSGRRLAAAAAYAAAVAAVVALAAGAGGMSLPSVSSLLKMPRFALEGFGGASSGRDGKKRMNSADAKCVDEKHDVVKTVEDPGAIVPVACDAIFDDSKMRAPAASRDPPPDAAEPEHDDVSVTLSELVADRNRAELFNACRLRRQTKA